jgi:hypothetical protein
MSQFIEQALRSELLQRLRSCGVRDDRHLRHVCRIASKVARAFADFQYMVARGDVPKDHMILSKDEAADKAVVLSEAASLIDNMVVDLPDDDNDGVCPGCRIKLPGDGSCCDECGWTKPQ